MNTSPLTCSTLIGLVLTSASIAHDGDPKATQERTPWPGPSWRSDVDHGSLAGGFDADGLELAANLTMGELGGGEGADLWGYTSPSGREYALMTTTLGTNFVEITNPGNPQVLDFLSGPNCLWRDVKVFEDHCYIVSDCGGGIQVVSLANIDSGQVTLVNTVTSGGTTNTHNIAMDPVTGLIARCGGGNNVGLRFYDASANKANPPFVGEWTPIYVHDAQLRTFTSGPFAGQTLAFCCGGMGNGSGSTRVAVVNVTNPGNPVLLGEEFYPGSAYCHQGWLSEDNRTFYVNDELYSGSSSTFIFDLTDPTNPTFVNRYTNGLGSSCHNCYTKGDLLFAANYRSGLRVFDISDRFNPTEVSYFDTYPENNGGGFNGAWSVYPYFDSGTLIISDIERGLFVLSGDFVSVGFNPVGEIPSEFSSAGEDLSVTISVSGGELDSGSGVVVFNDGSGSQQVPLTFDGLAYNATLPALNCPGQIALFFSIRDTEGNLYQSTTYTGTVADGLDVQVALDFEASAGWTAQTNATTGGWERGVPTGDSVSVADCSAPPTDADGSGSCWITGNGFSESACANDIDSGQTVLSSAIYAPAEDPAATELSFYWWYDNTSANNQEYDDAFVVELSGNSGASWTTILTVPQGNSAVSGWTQSAFAVTDYVTVTSGLQVRFTASDIDPGSVVEAGVDGFRIQTLSCQDEFDPADLNQDGAIDGQDLAIVLANWNCAGIGCDGDINGDAVVNGQDLAFVLANWMPL
ncbi:MAG: choice-of-anchor B family protein [Planctomycetota bacterium]|nr:choice-of-anchor B family protein [Planctomycetota bacterium]